MEKTAADWEPEVAKLKQTTAAASTYLVNGRAPQPGTIFVQKNLARTLRTLARGGRDAFYRGDIARAIVDYCQKNGGFLSMEDFAAQKSNWVEPISTTYRDLDAVRAAAQQSGAHRAPSAQHPGRHRSEVDAHRSGPLLPHADRRDEDRLCGSQPLHRRPGLCQRSRCRSCCRRSTPPAAARSSIRRKPSTSLRMAISASGNDTTYFTVVDKDRMAVSFINSIFNPSDRGSWPAKPASCCTTGGRGSRSIPRIPTNMSPASVPFTP